MQARRRTRGEIKRLGALAWPIALTQAATMMLGFVDLLMVGRLGGEALAAVGLANPCIFGALLFASGMIFGIDPLVTQAHGAGNGAGAARAFQRGVLLALALSPPVMIFWLFSEELLLAIGLEPALAAAAERYIIVQLPSVPFFLCSGALRQYLQGREIIRPAMVVVLIDNLLNALFNWVLIFGNLGFPALGIMGAGLATCLTRICSLLLLVGIVRGFRLHEGAWTPWRWNLLRLSEFRLLLSIGIPSSLQIALEMWAFNLSNWVAGLLGAGAIAGHVIVLHLASFSFMFVLGISQATMVRVGNLIGAGRGRSAERAGWIGIAMGAGVMALFGLVFLVGRSSIPWIYTSDEAVVATAVTIMPLAAAFQVFDGLQNVCCGVLRGMGRPLPAALANLVGYWMIALPLGAWLAFRSDLGLVGLWLGLAVGLVVVALALLIFLLRRGPASVTALASRPEVETPAF